MGEEYLHCHYPYETNIEDFGWDRFDQYSVDVIGNVLTLYCEDRLEDPDTIKQYLHNIERDYNPAVAKTTEELLEDFQNVENNKEMMSHTLNNPEPVFRRYTEHRG